MGLVVAAYNSDGCGEEILSTVLQLVRRFMFETEGSVTLMHSGYEQLLMD